MAQAAQSKFCLRITTSLVGKIGLQIHAWNSPPSTLFIIFFIKTSKQAKHTQPAKQNQHHIISEYDRVLFLVKIAIHPTILLAMSFKELKPELMELQTIWGTQIQAAKAPKGTEGAPFPVKVLLEMEQPPSCSHWDVEWLKVLFVIEGPELDAEDPEDLPLRVEFPQHDLPQDVRELMADMTLSQWQSAVAGSTEGPRWRLQETLSWVQAHYDKLLRVIPKCVDWYMGVDKNDVSQRRYTITPQVEVVIAPTLVLKKKAGAKGEGDDSDDGNSDAEEEGISEEEKARREAYKAKKLERDRLQLIKEQREEQQYQQEIARKREDAMAARERGEVVNKPTQLSKKELEEKRKSKQGCRTSKTGSKATKYAGEGSAVEKAKAGGGGKKKK
jgi:hypothetical protein